MHFYRQIFFPWLRYISRRRILGRNYYVLKGLNRSLGQNTKNLHFILGNKNKILLPSTEVCLLSMTENFQHTLFKNQQLSNFPVPPNTVKFHLNYTLGEYLLIKFAKQYLSKAEEEVPKEILEEWGGPEAYNAVAVLNDSNFNDFIAKNHSVLVYFSAPWCHHCRRLRKMYGQVALQAKQANVKVVFATLDVTSNPVVTDENGIVGIPYIVYFENGKSSPYRGKRTGEDLLEFVKNPGIYLEAISPDV